MLKCEKTLVIVSCTTFYFFLIHVNNQRPKRHTAKWNIFAGVSITFLLRVAIAAAIGVMGSQATRRNPSSRASSLQAKQMEVRVLHATVDRW